MGQDMSAEEEEQFYYHHKVTVYISLVELGSSPKFAIQKNCDGSISLPCLPLKAGDSVLQTAKRLFKKCTGCDSDWFVLKQVGVLEPSVLDTEGINVLYGIVISQHISLIKDKFFWADYEKLSTYPKLLEVTGMACGYNRVN